MVSGISLTPRVGGIDVVPVAYPVDLAGRRMIVGLASANELAGLAPLLDAFPFTFDASGYPVMKQQQALPARFTPSPSPEQSESSMTASEDEIARFARDSVGVMQAIIAGPGTLYTI